MTMPMIHRAVKKVTALEALGTIPTEQPQRTIGLSTMDVAMGAECECTSVISSSHHPVTTIDVAMEESESASVLSALECPSTAPESSMDMDINMDMTPAAKVRSTAQSSRAKAPTAGGRPKPKVSTYVANGRTTPQWMTRPKGGRPKGSTKAVMDARRKAAKDEKDKIAHGSLTKGQLETEDLAAGTIPTATCGASTSCPMAWLEPYLVEFCIRLAATGEPIKKKIVLELACSLISGTETERKYSELLKEYSMYDPEKTLLTNSYLLEDFWRRNKSLLKVDGRDLFTPPRQVEGNDGLIIIRVS